MFDTTCPYDAIVGRDFLSALQIDPCFSTHTVKWDHLSIAFKSRAFWSDLYHVSCCLTTTYAIQIQESLYQPVAAHEVAIQQKHLSPQQQADLTQLLDQYPRLFNGQLGLYTHKKLHLELHDNVTPVHLRGYQTIA